MSFKDFLLTSQSATAAAQKEEVQESKTRRVLVYPEPPSFYINKLPLVSSLPPETKRWIRDASDERAAVEYGCRFSEARGMYTVEWIESNCILYEGDTAGENLSAEDWQFELFMQGWGWLYFSEEWAVRTGDEQKGWIRRFTEINGWVPKKNTKSPTLAAAGLYTLLADGERGQKCYSVAIDKNQAGISHAHAINFVKFNPTLSSYCQVHETTKDIVDHRTQSRYSIKAGAVSGGRERNEGLNGSLFVDEGHVVSDAQMAVLSRAGISRRQRLLLMLSTAGPKLTSYGHRRWIDGRENIKSAEKGLDFNFRLKHLEFAIPATTSLDDLRDKTKINAFIDQANPTIGRVIVRDEILQDWRESCISDTKLTEFAMYRLNLWSSSGGLFVAGSDWDKCQGRFTLKSMESYPCVIGGDYAKKRDMCCILLAFAVPKMLSVPTDPFDPDTEWEDREVNVPHIHPYFFLPRKAVDRYKRQIDLDDYADRRLLTIVDGSTIRPQVIAKFIAGLGERYDVRKVGSDSYYSTDVAACLNAEYGWDVDGEFSRYAMIGGTAATVGPAVEQLQNCILNQELVHRGHAIMDWQLGNVTLVEDTNQNRRFEKPKSDDYRKIDGWSALTNAIFIMMSDPTLYPGQTFSIKA